MSVNSKMTAIADAIREKTGGTSTLTLDQMAVDIAGIDTSENLDDVLASQKTLISDIKTALSRKWGSVIDVITAAELPATVTDGEIVVITGTTAENIFFSYATPNNPTSGDIWIHTVDNGGYSLAVGSSTVAPGATMQYTGSEWEYRDAYIGVDGTWKMFSTLSPLSTLTWEQIIAIANSGEDCSNFFAVGDTHDLLLTTGELITAVIGDFNHNTITGTATTAAIAFTFQDCLSTTYAMNSGNTNSGGWNGSQMRTSRMPAILNTFPAELTADGAMKHVDVVATAGSADTSLVTSSDRLRLHSIMELGVSYGYAGVEGTEYAYYASGNRVKTVNGTASAYWTRSPRTGGSKYFCIVTTSGRGDAGSASAPYGVACCFDI